MITRTLTSCTNNRVSVIGSYAFAYCNKLTSVTFPACTFISAYAFMYCSNLSKIYLTASTICSLANSNAFSYTSIWSNKGSIFVPSSLVASYKAATNWAFFSNRIFGVTPATITFTIDGTTYQAEEGMTWSEWCESSYNTNQKYTNLAGGISSSGGAFVHYNGTKVSTADTIISNASYTLKSDGGMP